LKCTELDSVVRPLVVRNLGQRICIYAHCWVLRDRETDLLRRTGSKYAARLRNDLRYRPYFENYIVDASILMVTAFEL
jgi:hypothetical protein